MTGSNYGHFLHKYFINEFLTNIFFIHLSYWRNFVLSKLYSNKCIEDYIILLLSHMYARKYDLKEHPIFSI